jgi:hypothetical protein
MIDDDTAPAPAVTATIEFSHDRDQIACWPALRLVGLLKTDPLHHALARFPQNSNSPLLSKRTDCRGA